jgi:short-subunit dehydrogenase
MNPEPKNQNPSTGAPEHPRTCLVTGASSGIGAAFADVFARDGYDLVLVARRLDRLEAVAARLRQAYGRNVHVIVSDLAQADAPRRLCEEMAARGLTIDALVNNAGYGVPGAYVKSPWPRHADFLNVMVAAVAELTHRLLPGMLERGHGRIINVASLAGLVPAPAGHTLYGAAKAFLIKFSEALAHEVRGRGVQVTAVCPGFTLSEFHDVTGTRASVSRLPAFLWMDAPAVAREGYAANAAGAAIYVTGRVNRLLAWLVRTMPQALVSAVNRRAAASYRHT